MSNEKRVPGGLGYVGDYIYIYTHVLPSYVGIIMNHYKNQDLLLKHSIMESKSFFFAAHAL